MTPDEARKKIYEICDKAGEVVYVSFWKADEVNGGLHINLDTDLPLEVMKQVAGIIIQIEKK